MIRNYVKQYEAWLDLDPDDIDDFEVGTRKPSNEVLKNFFKAIQTKNFEDVKNYINLDYDVNAEDEHGDTGLRHASCLGLYDIANILIKNGANVNHKNKVQMTPLICACYSSGNEDVVDLLLKHGADVNAQDEDGRTALYYACAFNNENNVKSLLEYGADVNIKEMYERTPLMVACSPYKNKVNKNIVELLIENGADIEAKDKNGETAYDYCPARNKKIREMLIF